MAAEPLIELAAQPAFDGRVRKLIRMGLAQRAAQLHGYGEQERQAFDREMAEHPLDGADDHANRQHYAVPSSFFVAVLGPRLKYSCCWWESDTDDLGAAEAAMIDHVIARAELADGQRILDLGCGWGALSLELARRFPAARIVALSGATEQRRFIEQRRDIHGYRNLDVVTADIGRWQGAGTFDRIVSVEMFEHVRNWPMLMHRLGNWLNRGGLLFAHVFCHAYASYFFEHDVTARHFFTGGMMPACELLPRHRGGLLSRAEWTLPGLHYRRTAEAWLRNLDVQTAVASDALALGDDPRPVSDQIAAWRLFFMITAESFGFDDGRRWMVAHYLFEKP
jgi:cyclopropane-fatty-acyl-phospholipid synthase